MLVLILTLALIGFGADLKLSDYATPNDNLSDSADFQQAVDDLETAGGGTLRVTEGIWDFDAMIDLTTFSNANNSIVIKGEKGAVIKPDLSGSTILFYAGNQNQFSLENLVIVGDGNSSNSDAGYILYSNNVNQTRIIGCQFFGLKVTESVVYFGNTDGVIRDSLFYGTASIDAVVHAENYRGLTVSDSEFLDYGHLNGTYYSKTPEGNANWIKLNVTSPIVNATGLRQTLIQNTRFDEGATYAINADGITYLQVTGITDNVANVNGAAGITLNNVKYSEVKMSSFGYATNARPAIQAFNNSTVYVDAVWLGASVFYGQRDQGSQSFFNLKACSSGCGFSVL